jgi:hypothetical protein
VSGTQIIRATIQDELARTRRRGWNLAFVIGIAFAIAWALPRIDQTAWSIPPAVAAAGILGGAVGAAHRQRMFGRKLVSQVTSALLTMTTAAAMLAGVVLVNRVVAAAPGASPLEQGMRWVVEEGISPFAPVVVLLVLIGAWIPGLVLSQRRIMAEATVWRATHGPDGFTPIR